MRVSEVYYCQTMLTEMNPYELKELEQKRF
jgi:hypothetical protein